MRAVLQLRVPTAPRVVAAVLAGALIALPIAWIATWGRGPLAGRAEPGTAPTARGAAGAQPPSPAQAAVARAAGGRALALVGGASAADLGYRLRFAPPGPAGVRAQTDRAARTITVHVAPGEPTHLVAHDLAHELGHALDDRALSHAERAAYLRRRGAPGARWWPGASFSDYATGAGDFAEVYALCHAASPEFRGRLGPRPEDPCGLLPAAAVGGRLGGR